MVKRSLWCGVLVCLWAASCFGSILEPAEFSDAEQDGNGHIWAISQSASAQLWMQQGDSWQIMPLPAHDLGLALFLNRRRDGHILAFWSGSDGNFTITEHTDSTSRIVTRLGRSINAYLRMQVFVDSQENLWLTEMQGEITRVTPEGDTSVHYRPSAKMLLNAPSRDDPTDSDYNPLLATEDGTGKIWFWAFTPQTQSSYATLRGLLVYDGHRFIYHEKIPPLPDNSRFGMLAPKDPHHLWLSINTPLGPNSRRGQLLTLDTETLATSPAPELPEAFDTIERIFSEGSDTDMITSSFEVRTLWRLHENVWQKIIPRLDHPGVFLQPWKRPYALAAAGLLMANVMEGPTFVPKNGGAAMKLDWRSGFAPTQVQRLFVTPDQQLFALQESGHWLFKGVTLPPEIVENHRIQLLHPEQPLFFDKQGHGWGVLDAKKRELNEWTGKDWIAHHFPEKLDVSDVIFTSDSRQRSWLRTSKNGKPVAIFDSSRSAWQVFPSFSAALKHELPKRPVVPPQPVGFYEPIYSKDGRVAYLTGDWKLAYFDGSWHFWSRREIKGDNRPFLNAIAFTPTGQLHVNAEGETWYYSRLGGWKRGQFRFESAPSTSSASKPLPSEWSNRNPNSQVTDNQQTVWFTLRGQLYKCLGELVCPAFTPQEYQPFMDGRPLHDAFVDAQGKAFFLTYSEGRLEYVVVTPRLPLPHTTINPLKITDDTATFSFTTLPADPVLLQWRIDDGAWQSTSENTPITVKFLANGPHTLEAVATNQELSREAGPARLRFSIHVDIHALIIRHIRHLITGSSDERKEAYFALEKYPAIAKRELKIARTTAGDDQRWWIDAALQEIERQQSSKPASDAVSSK